MTQHHTQIVSVPSLATAVQLAADMALKGYPSTARVRDMQWEVVIEL